MHHEKFVFCVAVFGACILQIWAENPMQNGKLMNHFILKLFIYHLSFEIRYLSVLKPFSFDDVDIIKLFIFYLT